jgi:transcriptional regulator with XRE-family HTH domain
MLAERANLGVNIVGRLERAVIAPGLVTLLKLSTALDVTRRPANRQLSRFPG